MFSKSKKACTKYLTKLLYDFVNLTFFVKAFFTWIPGTSIFTYLLVAFFRLNICKCVGKKLDHQKGIDMSLGILQKLVGFWD